MVPTGTSASSARETGEACSGRGARERSGIGEAGSRKDSSMLNKNIITSKSVN